MTNDGTPRCQWCFKQWSGFNWERWRCWREPNGGGQWCDQHDPQEKDKRRAIQAQMATLEAIMRRQTSGGGRD